MKNKYLIAIVLAISLLISIPIISSASNIGYFVSGYYQCSIEPDFTAIGDDDYYIEAQFTLPFGDDITYTSIGIFGSLGMIGYQSGSNTFTTVYQNGAWTDYKYRVVDFGTGIYLTDTNYNDLILFYHYVPPTPENCTFYLRLSDLSPTNYPFHNTFVALNGTATFSNVNSTVNYNYYFRTVNVLNGSFDFWGNLSDPGVITNAPFMDLMKFEFKDTIYPTFENSPNLFNGYGFFLLNGDVNPSSVSPPSPPPNVPSVPEGYFDNFFMNLLKAPFDALDSLIIYETSNGFQISLFGVCSAVMGFSILIWLLKIVAGG